MLIVIFKERLYRSNRQGIYLSLIAIIYFLTAVLQSYLTRFAESFRQFSVYFFLASSIFLIAGIVLYSYPELLQQFQQKYFSSNLKEKDKNRIIKKIKNSAKDRTIFLNSELNLKSFCALIEEKPHHVSQVFSSAFSTSFSNFVNEQRVAIAKDILADPSQDEMKILAVAFECGFNNNVTFNKAFVKFTGLTPGKFRKERSII
jgi:AraC-like DNA-binding protein